MTKKSTTKPEPKEEPLDPFKPLIELAPEVLIAERELWEVLMRALGVTREHEVHSLNNVCPDEGCKRLLAFRAFIGVNKKADTWQRWQTREKKKALKDYLRRLSIAFARERFDHGAKRLAKKIAAIRKEAERDYAFKSLFNQYQDHVYKGGRKPEVY